MSETEYALFIEQLIAKTNKAIMELDKPIKQRRRLCHDSTFYLKLGMLNRKHGIPASIAPKLN